MVQSLAGRLRRTAVLNSEILHTLSNLAGRAYISDDGIITLSELEFWLTERVKTLTGGRQHRPR